MANEKCAVCGASIALVGLRHRCIPPDIEIVAGGPPLPEPQLTKTLDSTYRYRNVDERRAYMRGYMQRRRAKEKLNGS